MSNIQTLPTQFSLLAGSMTAEVVGGESITTENQAFASTLSALLADYLQSGAVPAELPQDADLALAAQGQDLAGLAFSVELEGQGISALDGTALPPGFALAGMLEVEGETDLAQLSSDQTEAGLLPTDVVAVAAPVLESAIEDRSPEVARGDALGAALAVKQDGAAAQQKPQLPFGFQAADDQGKGGDLPPRELLGDGGLLNAKTAEKVALEVSATLTGAALKSALAGSASSQAGDSANVLAPLAPPANITTSGSGSLPQTPAISISPHQSGFDQELGERILWMTKNQLPAAEIRLNPAHLGPVEARITVSNDQVSVVLVAHHSTTRDALEMALPRLREMFADSGLTLSDANVSGQSSQQQQQQSGLGDQRSERQAYGQPAAEALDNEVHASDGGVTHINSSVQSVLDVFA